MITPGGEIAFVSKLITESSDPATRTKIQWFSSMLGKLSSVNAIVEALRVAQCDNYSVAEFIQGQKTKRWCVAWSWLGYRPSVGVARSIPALEKRLLPFPSAFEFEIVADGASVDDVGEKVDGEIAKLDVMQWRWKAALATGVGVSSNGDCWSRKARRRKEQGKADEEMRDANEVSSDDDDDDDVEEEKEARLAFKVQVASKRTDVNLNVEKKSTAAVVVVHVRWLQGHEAVLFESFCGWLKRRVENACMN